MKKRWVAAAVFFAAALLILILVRCIPGFANAFCGVAGPAVLFVVGGFFGLFPFSVVELLLYAAICLVPLTLILRLAFAKKKGILKRTAFFRWCAGICLIASVIFLLYELGEDAHYFRMPFSVANGIGQGSYTTEELKETAALMAARVNAEVDKVERDGDGLMQCSANVRARCREAIGHLGETYPQMAGFCPKPKAVLFSELLSRAHFAGIFFACTMEANFNRDMTAYNIPASACHELGHAKGVMMENEANFVGYLACIDAPDADLRYSGALMGWIYVGNELYKRDRAAWREIAETLDARANKDLEANTAFWKSYESTVSATVEKLNDGYIKSKGQAGGVETYDRVVDLIVSYEKGR